MILSYEHSFVFIKTRKCAGTSVEIALSSLCGPRDVITDITPVDEYLRMEVGRPCQNFLRDRATEQRYLDHLRFHRPRPTVVPQWVRDRSVFTKHMGIGEVIDRAGIDAQDFLTFTIERHPYDKAVSFANFLIAKRAYRSGAPLHAELDQISKAIDSLIESGKLRTKLRNVDLYAADGVVLVDRILRYERLDEDLAGVLAELGLPPVALPSTKVGQRDRSVPAAELLTSAQRAWIRDTCREEFELLGFAP